MGIIKKSKLNPDQIKDIRKKLIENKIKISMIR